MATAGVVEFNYTAFITAYPEFATISQGAAQNAFDQTTLLVDNTSASPICDIAQRTIILNMGTAHFCKIFAIIAGKAPSGVPGRIGNASEGSVSVGFVYSTPTSDLAAFWNQTSYGAALWAATVRYRTGFYVPPPIPVGRSFVGSGIRGILGQRYRW